MEFYVVVEIGKSEIRAISDSLITMENCETHKIDLELDHPALIDTTGYLLEGGKLIYYSDNALKIAKENKLQELSIACQKSIEYGFDYAHGDKVYHFSLDQEAQLNFSNVYQLMRDGLVESTTWTVQVDGEYSRLEVNQDMMKDLNLYILRHRTQNISKFRDTLSLQVQQAKDIATVESIRW